MNYNERIKDTSLKINVQYIELLNSMKNILDREKYEQNQEGVSMPINTEEANILHKQVLAIRENINTFNYYTAFYPNKDKIWRDNIEYVNHISNILDKLEIEKNIREV